MVHDCGTNPLDFAGVKYAQGLKVGAGLAEGTQMGRLANPRRMAAMDEFHEDAVKAGAQVLAGGKRIGDAGNFWEPTVPSAEMPFGGLKDSGYGSEGGPEALDAYLNTRAVAVMNV
jgi:acyl-CoA reductase-like NAD-dependent aldehyde dehydrogenase